MRVIVPIGNFIIPVHAHFLIVQIRNKSESVFFGFMWDLAIKKSKIQMEIKRTSDFRFQKKMKLSFFQAEYIKENPSHPFNCKGFQSPCTFFIIDFNKQHVELEIGRKCNKSFLRTKLSANVQLKNVFAFSQTSLVDFFFTSFGHGKRDSTILEMNFLLFSSPAYSI